MRLGLMRERGLGAYSGVGHLRLHRAATVCCSCSRLMVGFKGKLRIHLEAERPLHMVWHAVGRRWRSSLGRQGLVLDGPSVAEATRVFVGGRLSGRRLAHETDQVAWRASEPSSCPVVVCTCSRCGCGGKCIQRGRDGGVPIVWGRVLSYGSNIGRMNGRRRCIGRRALGRAAISLRLLAIVIATKVNGP